MLNLSRASIFCADAARDLGQRFAACPLVAQLLDKIASAELDRTVLYRLATFLAGQVKVL